MHEREVVDQVSGNHKRHAQGLQHIRRSTPERQCQPPKSIRQPASKANALHNRS